ncbi:MAG: SURF1 family protein [Candidatus Nanopelagicales bacterium]
MLTLLRTPRWIGFTAAALVAIVAFGLLSLWQWHRAEQKRAEFAAVEEQFTAAPVAVRDLSQARDWEAVTLSGTYDPQRQYLVRNQPQNGANGFWVVTLLDTEPRDIWVVRGWVPADLSTGQAQQPPAPPGGAVDLTGYARVAPEGPAWAEADLPAAQISQVAVADLDQAAGVTTTPFFVIASRDPALAPIPLPEATDSRNLSYAGQWLLFAAIAIGGWYLPTARGAGRLHSRSARGPSRTTG